MNLRRKVITVFCDDTCILLNSETVSHFDPLIDHFDIRPNDSLYKSFLFDIIIRVQYDQNLLILNTNSNF